MKSLLIALSMYSKIPVPQVEWSEEKMKYVLCFFPVVGVIEGGLFVLLWMLLHRFSFGAVFQAAVLTAFPVCITGGIHMDGFLDTVDALSSWQSKERRLEILKDSHTGAFAIMGGVLYLLLYAGGVAEIQSLRTALMVGAGFFLSRILSAGSLSLLKNAKKEGLAYTFMSSAHISRTRLVLVAELLIAAGILMDIYLAGAALMGILAGIVWIYYWKMSYRQFGGITGDLAGFFLQVCELVMLYGIVILEKL